MIQTKDDNYNDNSENSEILKILIQTKDDL